VARLRREGETVIHVLPGHAHEIDEFACDRQLVKVGGGWQVQTVAA
jgi:ATP phosphoribosyltransferase regulatory subunit